MDAQGNGLYLGQTMKRPNKKLKKEKLGDKTSIVGFEKFWHTPWNLDDHTHALKL